MGACSDLTPNRTQGVHHEASTNRTDPLLATLVLDQGGTRDSKAGGAPFILHLHGQQFANDYNRLSPLRNAARARGHQVILKYSPFSAGVPGDASKSAQFLAGFAQVLAYYSKEDVVWMPGNHNGNTWTGTDEEWWALEGAAVALAQAAGQRVAIQDDKGLVYLVTNIVERSAAWTAAGASVAGIEFFGFHEYVLANFVPALVLLAQDALVRAGVVRPLVATELAWDFIHSSATPPANTRAGRPDLFTEPALTWTRYLIAWFRHHDVPFALFDNDLLYVQGGGPSGWGLIYQDESRRQPAWVSPSPAAALALGGFGGINDVAQRAYVLRSRHGGTVQEATDAATRITDGYLFER